MKTINETYELPTMISLNANAIWNNEKAVWEVTISQIALDKEARTNEPLYYQGTQTFEIVECDEFVIPWAILQMNGINTNKIDEILGREVLDTDFLL